MPKENRLLETLLKNKLTLAIAESCTGGLLSHRLTNIPGSSGAFLLGIISYSNASKNTILKIPADVIQNKGAVSDDAARLMACNIRKLSGASIGLGITGIAGPAGATENKPVGTVFIALSSKKKTAAAKFRFSGCRLEIKKKTADKAIAMLLEFMAIEKAMRPHRKDAKYRKGAK